MSFPVSLNEDGQFETKFLFLFLLCIAGVFPWSCQTSESSLSKHEPSCRGLRALWNCVCVEDDEKGKNARSTEKLIFIEIFLCLCI